MSLGLNKKKTKTEVYTYIVNVLNLKSSPSKIPYNKQVFRIINRFLFTQLNVRNYYELSKTKKTWLVKQNYNQFKNWLSTVNI